MKQFRLVVTICLMAICLFSCKSKQPVAKQREPAMKEVVNPTKSLISNILAAEPSFQTAQASKVKATINYQQRQISVSATINIMHDSAIVVSVQPLLGIEMVRLEMTKHNVVLIDKMNRKYVSMTMDEVQKETGYPVTFADVENLLTNRIFVIGHDDNWLLNTPLEKGTADGLTTLAFKEKKINYQFGINAANRIEKINLSEDGSTYKGELVYKNFVQSGDVNFPMQITVDVKSAKLSGSGSLTIQTVRFNSGANVIPMALNKYMKTTLSNIIPM